MTRVSRLALAVAVAASSGLAARAAEVDPMLPKESEQVMFVNFKQLLDSDLAKKYVLAKAKEAMKVGEMTAILEALGLDPLTDITSVTAGIWGGQPPKPGEPGKPPAGPGQPPSVVAIVRGKFDGEKLLKAADDLSVKFADKVKISVVEEGDFRLIKLVGDTGSPFFVSVADENTLVGGTGAALVAECLTAKKTKAKARLSREMTALVLRQDAKASLFFCQRTEGKLDQLPFNFSALPGVDGDQMKEQIGKVLSISMTLRVGKEIGAEVTAGLKDADAAEGFGANVGKLLDLAKSFLNLTAGAAAMKYKPITEDIVKTVKHEVKKSDVVVSVKLTAEALALVFGEDE